MNLIQNQRDIIRNFINSAGSSFVGVEFIKKDGEFRSMTIQQTAGHEMLAGNDATKNRQMAVRHRAENNPHLMSVYEVNKGWRSINLDTVTKVNVYGLTIDFKRHEKVTKQVIPEYGVVIKPVQYFVQSSRTGKLVGVTAADIINILGFKPNTQDDPDKVVNSWSFTLDGVDCAIWDYKGSHLYHEFSTFGPSDLFKKVFGILYV
jgi:hypothetical protein